MNKNLFQSFYHAFSGLFHLLESQRNARIHLMATVAVIALGLWLQIPLINWLFITLAISLVWICELFNTAIEHLFNLLEPNHNHDVKIGKDVAAAAVLISALLSVIIGLITLGPSLIEKIKSLIK